MYPISQSTGLVTLLVFGLSMIGIVYFLTRKQFNSKDAFLVARREVGWFRGSLSIAVSWIWAPAVFIASMQAYSQGIAGAFWFIVPNIVCFFIFAPLAMRLRRFLPDGYTLPEFVLKRYDNDKKTHIAFLILYFGYQLGAIIINTLASGVLLHALTGISFYLVVILITVLVLVYAMMSGLEASIITDVIQMAMVLLFCFILRAVGHHQCRWFFCRNGRFRWNNRGIWQCLQSMDCLFVRYRHDTEFDFWTDRRSDVFPTSICFKEGANS